MKSESDYKNDTANLRAQTLEQSKEMLKVIDRAISEFKNKLKELEDERSELIDMIRALENLTTIREN